MKKLFLLSLITLFLLFSCASTETSLSGEKKAVNEEEGEIKIEEQEAPTAVMEEEISFYSEGESLSQIDISSRVDSFSYAYGVTTMSEILSSGITFNSLYFSKGLYDAYHSPLSPSLSSLGEVNSVLEEYISRSDGDDIAFGPRVESTGELDNLGRDESFPLLFSYAYGFSVMQSIKFSDIDLSLVPFISGMLDEIYAAEELMTAEEISAAIDDYIAHLNEEYYLSLEKESEKMKTRASIFLEKNKEEEGVITLDNGVQILYLEKVEGSDKTATQYDTVIMDYNEYVLDYDSFDMDFTDVVRDEEVHVINLSNALQSALVLMHEGDAVRVFVPPELSDKYEIDEIGLLYIYDIALQKIL